MKSFLAITLLFSSLAWSTTMDLFIASVSPVDAEIKAVSVSKSGLLYIKKTNGEEKTLRLAKKNVSRLSALANRLNGVELKTEQRLMVCKMILPAHDRQALFVRFDNQFDLQVVLSVESCAVSSLTRPTEEHDLLQARLLKSQLVTLAQQLAEAN